MMEHQLALGLGPSQERQKAKAQSSASSGGIVNTFEHVGRRVARDAHAHLVARYAALVTGRSRPI
jgi:hypothetical protein